MYLKTYIVRYYVRGCFSLELELRLPSEVQQLLRAGIAQRSGDRFLLGTPHPFRLPSTAARDGHAAGGPATLAIHLSRNSAQIHRARAVGRKRHAADRARIHELHMAQGKHDLARVPAQDRGTRTDFTTLRTTTSGAQSSNPAEDMDQCCASSRRDYGSRHHQQSIQRSVLRTMAVSQRTVPERG